MARIRIAFAREHVDVEMADGVNLRPRPAAQPPALTDVAAAARQALASPLEFPPLHKSLTPDDHVAVVVAEDLSHLPELLTAVLEEILRAGVDVQRITLLCPPRLSDETPAWAQALPEPLRAATLEVHQPTDRTRLSYLATTKAGRRVYLNRTLVDADQLVVVGRIGYDPTLGYEGGLGQVYPALGDEETRTEFAQKPSHAPPGDHPWPVELAANEVGWLLGLPFVVQAIPGHGDELTHVLAGTHAAVAKAGRALLDKAWRVTLKRSVELVVATLAGDPARHTVADVTRAFAAGARIVQPGGRIVVLSHAKPELGPGLELARKTESPTAALALARQHKLPDANSLWELANAAQRAQLYLLSDLPRETAEELFVIPLDHAGQLQQLVNQAESCVVLADAHRIMAEVGSV